MGMRVKLVRRLSSAALEPILLDVTDLQVTTERNISSFAIPSNTALKVGLDFNLPRTIVQIRGVLADDDMVNPPQDTTSRTVLDCSQLLPKVSANSEGNYVMDPPTLTAIDNTSPILTPSLSAVVSQDSATHSTTAKKTVLLKWPSQIMKAYSSTRVVEHDTPSFIDGEKIYNWSAVKSGYSDGVLITSSGTISSDSKEQLTSQVSKVIGSQDMESHTAGDVVSRFSVESFLDGMGFKLHPKFWQSGHNHGLPMDNTPIFFKFDADAVSEFATTGSHVNPSLVSGSEPEKYGLPTIVIPIKDLFNKPEITENPSGGTAIGSPAASLAKAIENAVNSTLAVSTRPVAKGGGSRVIDAFTATVDADKPWKVKIEKTDAGWGPDEGRTELYTVVGPTGDGGRAIKNISGGKTAAQQYYESQNRKSPDGSYGTGGLDKTYGEFIYTSHLKEFYLPVTTKYWGRFSGGSTASRNISGPKSAGDKVQDLLGIFANSPVDSDREIVGIQIPYQTLIASNTVNAETRNFFLTYGNVPPEQKISDSNFRASGDDMTVLSYKEDEVVSNSSTTQWFSDIFDGLGTVIGVDNLGAGAVSMTTAVKNIWDDTALALTESSMGNGGGIRVVPSKFEFSYNAGNTEYTFNMLLSVVHHKIAP